MKKLFAFIIVLGTGSIDFAQAAKPIFYAGADVIRMSQKNEDGTGSSRNISGTAKTTNLRLNGGLQALDWLDAEVQVVLPKAGGYSDSRGSNVSLKTDVVAAFAKPKIDFGSVTLYGLVGIANTSSDISSTTTGGTSNKTNLAFGAGAQFAVTKNIAVLVDYVQYATDVDFGNSQQNTINAFGVGAKYTFK